MAIKQSQSDLEIKLQGLKDQFIEGLKATKLVVNPRIDNLTLTYEQRRSGKEILEGCKIIKLGLKAALDKLYKGNVEIHFETIEEESKRYKARLELLAEGEQEKKLAYEVLAKINEFITFYNQAYSKKR